MYPTDPYDVNKVHEIEIRSFRPSSVRVTIISEPNPHYFFQILVVAPPGHMLGIFLKF